MDIHLARSWRRRSRPDIPLTMVPELIWWNDQHQMHSNLDKEICDEKYNAMTITSWGEDDTQVHPRAVITMCDRLWTVNNDGDPVNKNGDPTYWTFDAVPAEKDLSELPNGVDSFRPLISMALLHEVRRPRPSLYYHCFPR